MKHKNKYRALLALVLATLLMTVCGMGVRQESAARAVEGPGQVTVEVSTVDELLAAMAPHTTVVLKEGVYDLTAAATYGMEELEGNYRWELVLGGAQLNISDLRDLHLVGRGQVSIVTRPRYAEVLSFTDCWGLRLEGLTLGHTLAPESCTGGVLSLNGCDEATVENCRLYGCGVLGISATACAALTVRATVIDTCSSGAVFATACESMLLEDCAIRDCGLSEEGAGSSLFFLDRCKGFALVNSEVTGNMVQTLLQNYWSNQVQILGCLVEENIFLNAMFDLQGRGVIVDKCALRLDSGESYYSEGSGPRAQDPAGQELTAEELSNMERFAATYERPAVETTAQPERTEVSDGRYEVHAATADELVAAIAPHTTILLEPGVYDLSTVEGYGGHGGSWYCWESDYDGYSLKILGVQGLTIQGAGKGETVIMAEPRYAAVFRFQDCEDLTIRGITAGHSEAPGYCTGNVLDFDGCWQVTMEDCGLYGCGVLGVWAVNTSYFALKDCEIYECTNGAAELFGCSEVSFEGCSIHDCDYNQICLYASDMTWDGQQLVGGTYEFQGRELLGELGYE